jgi:hypothetical protein
MSVTNVHQRPLIMQITVKIPLAHWARGHVRMDGGSAPKHTRRLLPDRKNLEGDLRLCIQSVDDLGGLVTDDAQRNDPIEKFVIS